MSFRPERLAEAIKKEISDLLRDSKDLRYASVYASVFGEPDQQKASIAALQKAQGFIRGELGRRIRLRYTPEITFKLDHSISHGTKILALIEDVKEKGGGQNE
jgi:ribosome-binding factor A